MTDKRVLVDLACYSRYPVGVQTRWGKQKYTGRDAEWHPGGTRHTCPSSVPKFSSLLVLLRAKSESATCAVNIGVIFPSPPFSPCVPFSPIAACFKEHKKYTNFFIVGVTGNI